jgi:hypothetical protein
VAAFLQTWLYFGLLFDILQAPVKTEDFLSRKEDGRVVVTANRLSQYVENWHKQYNPMEKNQKLYLSIRKRLGDAWPFVITYCNISIRENNPNFKPVFIPRESKWPLDPEICLSIMVLADSLSKASIYVCGIPLGFSWGVSELLQSRMLM